MLHDRCATAIAVINWLGSLVTYALMSVCTWNFEGADFKGDLLKTKVREVKESIGLVTNGVRIVESPNEEQIRLWSESKCHVGPLLPESGKYT